VLKGTFGPKKKKVEGHGRKLQNDDLHNLNSLPDITRITKSRWVRGARHVARMGELINA